jgi:ABC-type uncharacterized transport system ATPase subunit
VLTPDEADEILGLLRGMAAAGDITVLMISHKFREVNAFADEVTVLRRGAGRQWIGKGPEHRRHVENDDRRGADA